MSGSHYQPGLHRFAVATALATLALIGVGGLVTSHGAGLAVPDWPTTYGYNMFFFPISLWTGGVLYEHSHRLVASAVGGLTICLAVWLWWKDPRRWLRRLGVVAVVLVIAQGVLGGLRVTEMRDELGIFHATLAQVFLVLLSSIALVTSRAWWQRGERPAEPAETQPLRLVYGLTTVVIFAQLILGATMRHQHAGLAVPDFPLAYGRLWPDLSPGAVAGYNQARSELTALNPITPVQVVLHLLHRLIALLILAGVAVSAWWTMRHASRQSGLPKWTWGWLGLILLQVGLGAATVWTNKSADIATLHVALGATAFVLGFALWLWAGPAGRPVRSASEPRRAPALA
jgi:heme a synthase